MEQSNMNKDLRELAPVPKEVAREMQEDAVARFLAQGGSVQELKGRKNPKPVSAKGKSNSGMKLRADPTARFPTKSY
jgi:hypothetical protein